MQNADKVAFIIGAGVGISGAVATQLAAQGYRVAVAARNLDKLQALAHPINALAVQVDASDPGSIEAAFQTVERTLGAPDVVLYNPSARVRGELLSLDLEAATEAIKITAIGALATAQSAAKRMLPRASGTLLFTGATASVKGFPRSSVFAMGKFALRGLAQSLAKELGPAGIHVVHFVIDGSVKGPESGPDVLNAEAIASSYLAAIAQPKAAWSWEIELRSADEPF